MRGINSYKGRIKYSVHLCGAILGVGIYSSYVYSNAHKMHIYIIPS